MSSKSFPMTLLLIGLVCGGWAYGARMTPWGLKIASVPQAWQITRGTEDVVVAVIDTGIDVTHPDLKHSLWVNPGEIPGNRKDDDRNGYIDDVHGWNFVNRNGNLTDHNGHGTHVAGIIASKKTGVAPKVKILTLKYYAADKDNLKRTIQAFEYVAKSPYKIHMVNISAGGRHYSSDEYRAIQKLEAKGVLIIAAAGNEGIKDLKFYPAAYPLKNIISVASISRGPGSAGIGDLLPSSNYGKRVTIAAGGHRIRSTTPRGYGSLTGTSQATPHVSGTAALMLSVARSLTPEQVRFIVRTYAKPVRHLIGKVAAGGMLNAYRAVKQAGLIQYEILKTFYSKSFGGPQIVTQQTDFFTF